jgi:hypothetical protein
LILIADVKPKTTPFRANKGGRPQAAYWGDIERHLELEIKKRGFPKMGLKGWANQSDVERWVADQLQDMDQEAGESSIRDHVRTMLNKLRPET